MKLAVLGCAVCAPGLPDWATAVEVLGGRAAYDRSAVRDPSPVELPPNERRRLPATARAALGVGIEALRAAPGRQRERRDGVHFLRVRRRDHASDLRRRSRATLRRSRRRGSTIRCTTRRAATGASRLRSHAPSTSLCAFEGSFAAGLVEAAAQALAESRTVLLVAYDLPYPAPLSSLWNVTMPFCVALVLAPGTRQRSSADRDLARRRAARGGLAGGRTVRAAHEPRRGVVAAACVACEARGRAGRAAVSREQCGRGLAWCRLDGRHSADRKAAAAARRDGAAGRSRFARRATDRVPRQLASRSGQSARARRDAAGMGGHRVRCAGDGRAFLPVRRRARRGDDRIAREACATSCAKRRASTMSPRR